MKIKNELLVYSLGVIGLNIFIFGFAAFIMERLAHIDMFGFLILGTLFLFSTGAAIYLTYELMGVFISPVTNFKRLIEDTMHELNTPIATIKTNTAMLKKNTAASEVNKLERIELACEKLLDLYENLEYFAKKEAKLNQKTETKLQELLLSEIALLEDAYAKKGVLLSVDIEPINFVIDKKGLALAFSNLLTNALKFTNSGNSVEITLRNGILKVKDTGRGIAEDELIKIFDRYYQEDSAKEGCGIGLFLVKEFCDENRVSLFIRSEIGVGSEFTLDFDKIRKK